jgi:hypothetical protein
MRSCPPFLHQNQLTRTRGPEPVIHSLKPSSTLDATAARPTTPTIAPADHKCLASPPTVLLTWHKQLAVPCSAPQNQKTHSAATTQCSEARWQLNLTRQCQGAGINATAGRHLHALLGLGLGRCGCFLARGGTRQPEWALGARLGRLRVNKRLKMDQATWLVQQTIIPAFS